ncbi:MAG: threonine--tRNA ligase [Candidatus Magasanikbacteria bacterium]|nr:threonine--tRNA ligase [Candidatus Magasanikbacteria bacterium]
MANIGTMRHSCAHLIAAAVQSLYPEAKFGVGPTVENGFYYDIDFPEPIGEAELLNIEIRARELIKNGVKFEREEMTIDEAVKLFKKLGQDYKVELLSDIKNKGTTRVGDIEEVELSGDGVSIYKTGDFIDLCRGPHLDSSKEIGAFKLTKLAGAYWRGKNENPQLQRVYGVCFEKQNQLDEYLNMLAEAEKRDHRKIGAEQKLFFIDDIVGKGLIMWQPNGTIIRNEVEKLAVEKEREAGYVRVSTPHMAKEELFLTSGHLPYYKDSMYPPMVMDDGTYYMKAMNCPHHHIIYNHDMHSYRDLPLRIAEYGMCYRNELSGTLAGLLRVRGLAMNDAHIYCRKDQIKQEFKGVLDLTINFYKIFGLKDYWFRLSKWSPKHLDKYVNEPENWEYSQQVIREVLEESDVKFIEAEDEAAFYGPKVDTQFRSVIGREESMSTIQLDFAAKKRFSLTYTDETGKENNEVFVIHRAPLSTHERFIAFLIEHYAGIWPVWLSPVQVRFISVSEKHTAGAESLQKEFFDLGVRADLDSANETLGNRVRKAVAEKIPYIVVVGDKELEGGDWMIRIRGQEKQEKMSKQEFLERLNNEVSARQQ